VNQFLHQCQDRDADVRLSVAENQFLHQCQDRDAGASEAGIGCSDNPMASLAAAEVKLGVALN